MQDMLYTQHRVHTTAGRSERARLTENLRCHHSSAATQVPGQRRCASRRATSAEYFAKISLRRGFMVRVSVPSSTLQGGGGGRHMWGAFDNLKTAAQYKH